MRWFVKNRDGIEDNGHIDATVEDVESSSSRLAVGIRVAITLVCVALVAVLVAAAAGASSQDNSVTPEVAPATANVVTSVGVSEVGSEDETAADAANYVPDVVLMSVSEGMSAEEVETGLREAMESPVVTRVEHVSDGIMEVGLEPGSLSLDECMERIRAVSFVSAVQPNYVYAAEEADVANVSGASLADVLSAEDVADAEAAGEQPFEYVATESDVGGDKADVSVDLSAQGTDSDSDAIEDGESGIDDGDGQVTFPVNDTYARKQWALSHANVFEAWEAGITGKGVGVAIIDAGFNVSMRELKDRIVAVYNSCDGTSDVSGAAHGTHVACLLASTSNNGYGIAGIAPEVDLVLVNASAARQQNAYETSDLIKAYDYVLKNRQKYNIRVVSMSFGFNWSDRADADLLLYKKIDKAYAAGIVMVGSAGNFGPNSSYVPFAHHPGDYGNVIGVMGLDYSGYNKSSYDYASYNSAMAQIAERSNYDMLGQTSKNISAPGWNILTMTGPFVVLSGGTSYAASMVSGTLALMLQANPSLTPMQAKSALYSSAQEMGDAGWDRLYGFGAIDAGSAVAYATSGYGIDGPSFVAVGDSAQYEGRSKGNKTITYSVNNDVASVSSTGKLCGLKSGTVRLRGSSASSDDLYAEVNVVGPIKGPSTMTVGETATFTVSQESMFTYSWKTSAGKLATSYDSASLTATAAGKLTITATLTSDPSVVLTKTVTVKRKNIKGATVSAIKTKCYTGKAIKPKPTVKLSGKKLTHGKDYVLSYVNNVACGKAIVRITGCGTYRGTLKKAFVITTSVRYRTYVREMDWRPWKKNGLTSGLADNIATVCALKVKLGKKPCSGTIRYRTKAYGGDWDVSWTKGGGEAGDASNSNGLEAVEIKLTGKMSKRFNVYYRVYVDDAGWMGWAKNGAKAGSSGYEKKIGAIQVKLVPKRVAGPSSTKKAYELKG